MKRASGVLMPVFSLPSKYGIGCFSKEAYKFVDQLKKAGQSYWQILPLGPTGYGDSPYQSFSTYAGNPYFIDLKTLVKEGLLTKKECKEVRCKEQKRLIMKNISEQIKILKRHTDDFRKMISMKNFLKKMHSGWKIIACIWQLKTPMREKLERMGRAFKEKGKTALEK